MPKAWGVQMWVCSVEANCRTAGWCATSLLCCNNCVSPVCKRVLGLLSYESNFCEIQAFKGGKKTTLGIKCLYNWLTVLLSSKEAWESIFVPSCFHAAHHIVISLWKWLCVYDYACCVDWVSVTSAPYHQPLWPEGPTDCLVQKLLFMFPSLEVLLFFPAACCSSLCLVGSQRYP